MSRGPKLNESETIPDPASEPTVAPAPRVEAVRRLSTPPLVVALLMALVLGWSYRANLQKLTEAWTTDPDYSHGMLVVPVALLVAWRRLPGASDPLPRPTPWGLIPLALVLAVRAWAYESGEYWLETATIVPAVAALVWTCGGLTTLRRLWPAVAFLVFMLTIPGQFDTKLSLPLQQLAARGSCKLLRATGTWVLIEGNVILIGSDRLEVARACSGLAMLTSLAATICAMVLLFRIGLRERLVLLASIVPIALLCNVARIAVTAWCYQYFGSETGRAFAHDAAGWFMMPLAMILVGLELAWLGWLFEERPAAQAPADTRPVSVQQGTLLMGGRR